MFVLKNEYGNLTKTVETTREKEMLEKLGYKVVSATVGKEEINFDRMTVSQLEEFAEKNNIDLSKCENKAEKLQIIKSSING